MTYDSEHYYAVQTFLEDDELCKIWNIIEEGDNGTPHDIVEVMFNLLDENQLEQLEDIIVNQYGE